MDFFWLYELNDYKKSCSFTVTVPLFLSVGESGLGKSTLVNSLFLTDIYKDRKVPNAQGEISVIILCMWSMEL